MNFITAYFNRTCQKIFRESMHTYCQQLDGKRRSIELYLQYLMKKKAYVGNIIDSLNVTLENKYIETMENEGIACAKRIDTPEIQVLQKALNIFEAVYARIESDISHQLKQRVDAEAECDMAEQISLVS